MYFTLNIGLPSQLSWERTCLQCRRLWFDSWVGKIPWRRDRLPTPVFLGVPGGSKGKESTCNAEGGHGNPLQFSSLNNAHEQRSLVGYSPWGRKELDMTE